MISLEKTVFNGEALQALVAMQSEYTSLAQIKKCAKIFAESHDNDYMAIVVFNDNTMLKIVDDNGFQYDNDFDSSFIEFVVSVCSAYKSLDLCFEFDSLEELYTIVEDFSSNQDKLFELLISEYSYSYDVETLVNYVAENACIFEGSRSDYAYELIEDCYDTKSMGNLANYIDYDAFGRDIELEGGIQEISYNVYWTNAGDIY